LLKVSYLNAGPLNAKLKALISIKNSIMKTNLLVFLLAFAFTAHAQFKTGTFTDKKTKTSYRYITLGGLDWMQDDVTPFVPDSADVQTLGQRFVKRNSIAKYCPDGWRLPTLQEVRQLINVLPGEKNSTGGKTIDSAYLQSVFPFSLRGFYYTSRKTVAGNGFMTAFYTGTDTLRTFREKTGPAQVAIHIYSSGRGKVNFEPTFSHDVLYCRLRFVRDTAIPKK
jgi:hypothetical protein